VQPRLNGSDEPNEGARCNEHSFDPRRKQDARAEKAAAAALAMIVVVRSRAAMSGTVVVIVVARREMMLVRRSEHLAQTRRCGAGRRGRDHCRRHDDEQRIERRHRHSDDLAPASHRATGSFSTRGARPNRAGTLAQLRLSCGEMRAVRAGSLFRLPPSSAVQSHCGGRA
jgi:hypothetical protein